MKRILQSCALVAVFAAAAVAQPAPSLVTDVRALLRGQDFAAAERMLRETQATRGQTPEWLEALSWMGRGHLGASQWDRAEAFAQETMKGVRVLLASRPLDQEPRLPIALGAAIEVQAQVDAQRGARTDAVLFLSRELASYKGTSIEKRIQKNINLLSLEGTPAPQLDLSDHLGRRPAALDTLKGKVVLLFFWAHWCPDCKAQAPVLARLAETFGDQGLVIVAPTQRFGYVAGGRPASAADEARYIDSVRQASYPVLAGHAIPMSADNHVRFGVSTTPTLVLVDRQGVIRLYHPGAMPWDDLEPHVRRLVGTPVRRSVP